MDWRRASLGLVLVIPVLALLRYGMSRDPRLIPSPLPGRAAPEFALAVMDLAGAADRAPQHAAEAPDTVRLSEHRGEVIVLNFWASWCLACRTEHGPLSRVAERYRGQPVRFWGLLYNDTPEAGRRWIQEMGGQSYPALVDPGARTAIDYGLYGVPETFIVGPDGRVAYKHVGPVSEEILVHWIERLLQSPPATDP